MSPTFAKFKSNNALLIQGAHTQPMFMDMLRLSFQRHAAYCNSHGFDFWCNFGNPCPDRINGAWDKVFYLKNAADMHYEYIVWLDSDAVINDFEVDLRDALKDCEIGAVCHDPAKSKYLADRNIKKHNNVGCLYFKNTPLVKEFINEWWNAYPGEEGWFEQGTFNKMIESDKYKGLFRHDWRYMELHHRSQSSR